MPKNKLPRYFWRAAFALFTLLMLSLSDAQIVKRYSVKPMFSCQTDRSLAVISVAEIAYLLGQQNTNLSLYSLEGGLWRSLVFQVDHKDAQGRYILTSGDDKHSDHQSVLGASDELVIRHGDLGERLPADSTIASQLTLLEVELQYTSSPSRWFYINIDPRFNNNSHSTETLLEYDDTRDIIRSPVYKIGFSHEHPFLVDTFHWRQNDLNGWSADLTDMMKIRHKGKFWGLPFKRTQEDYSSQLLAVKTGPLRMIRRTENRVRVFWKLKTPALYIDYIMMPDGFVMDTLIDIPFNVSFFFSDLETLTTMDWNHTLELPALFIHSEKMASELAVNGQQTENENAFNQYNDRQFSVSSTLGRFDVKLEFADDFPIRTNLYLKDDLNDIDLPENFPGQFGNVGFRTTDWEKIDNRLHHLKFTVCMQK